MNWNHALGLADCADINGLGFLSTGATDALLGCGVPLRS